ncbi:MAG TPA: hypothetical protein VM029_15330, partial [Opitutaceae bacterium]|nr:hypothetical protein [Opitutaceae bacterium]
RHGARGLSRAMLRKSILLLLAGTAILVLWAHRSRLPGIPRAAPPSIRSTRSIASTASVRSTPRDITLAAPTPPASSTLPTEIPTDARAMQGHLIVALCRAGDHEQAAAVAAESPPEDRTDHLTLAYTAWAQREPEIALDAALMLDDPARQRTAFQAAVSGWARHDPQRLAECAAEFPEGPEKKLALRIALRAWVEASPAAAYHWYDARRASLDGVSRDDLADNE